MISTRIVLKQFVFILDPVRKKGDTESHYFTSTEINNTQIIRLTLLNGP